MSEIGYLSDSILVERISSLHFGLKRIHKKADLNIGQLFNGVGAFVSSYVQSRIDPTSTGSLIKSTMDLLSPNNFFQVHPMLGTLKDISDKYGYGAVSILNSIVGTISPTITSGQQATVSDVNQAGLAVASLEAVRIKSGKLSRFAASGDVLYGFFEDIEKANPGSGKSVMAGFISWFVKTILLSAGLLSTSGQAKDLVLKDTGQVGIPESNAPSSAAPAASTNLSAKLKPSGAGQKFHANDKNTAWVLPVINNNIEDTLLSWAVEIYPQLSGYEGIIEDTPSFIRVRDLFKSQYSGGDSVIAPPGFNKRIDIINQFAGDAYSAIQRGQ